DARGDRPGARARAPRADRGTGTRQGQGAPRAVARRGARDGRRQGVDHRLLRHGARPSRGGVRTAGGDARAHRERSAPRRAALSVQDYAYRSPRPSAGRAEGSRRVSEPARASGPGDSAVLVETSRALPLVSMTIATRAGATNDPSGKEGLLRL